MEKVLGLGTTLRVTLIDLVFNISTLTLTAKHQVYRSVMGVLSSTKAMEPTPVSMGAAGVVPACAFHTASKAKNGAIKDSHTIEQALK